MNYDQDPPVPLAMSYFQLLRVPNLFTAAADVAMGFLFVAGPAMFENPVTLSPLGIRLAAMLVGSSVLLYLAGVVLNDVFDLELDRDEQPDRPLPSGRIPVGVAQAIGWTALLIGLGLAVAAAVQLEHWLPAAVGCSLAAMVVLYDAVLKRTILGPPAMGACRMLNVLLGMSVMAALPEPHHWLVAGAIGVYITGVTWFARNDARRSNRLELVAAAVVMMTGVAMLGSLPLWTDALVRDLRADPTNWYLMSGLLGLIILVRCGWAIAEPSPGRVRVAVAQSIISLVVLDAAVTFAARGMYWALIVLVLLFPAMFLARWLRGT